MSSAKLGKRSASSPVLPGGGGGKEEGKRLLQRKIQGEGRLWVVTSVPGATGPGSLGQERQVTGAGRRQGSDCLHQSLAAIYVNSVPKPDGSRDRTFSPTIYRRRKSLLRIWKALPEQTDTPSPFSSTFFSAHFIGKSNPTVSKRSTYIFIHPYTVLCPYKNKSTYLVWSQNCLTTCFYL